MRHTTTSTRQETTDRAYLVGIEAKYSKDIWPIDSSMAELAMLANTAGAKVLGTLTQKIDRPSSSHYLGKGKVDELLHLKEKHLYNVVIFNEELSPRQQKNLEESLGVKVIDRTALILDIFAARAETREGQLQVELAQHQYLLPRLAGQWSHLERLGGGIGTRGPGESQIETDRRLVRNRIHRLQKQIEDIRKHRALYRGKRKKGNVPVVAMVGYTNAGKSTLLNSLSRAEVLAEDKLFCTLDPVTRRLVTPDNFQFLLTDTVGFIHKLPPSIVAAFRATLEELSEADLLLHIVDITHPNAAEQFETVEKFLSQLDLADKPKLTVLNKVDKEVNSIEEFTELIMDHGIPVNSILTISALKGWHLDDLFTKILQFLGNDIKSDRGSGENTHKN
ncbi:GTPase HflX [Chloroflexota bacterium]